MSGVDEAARVLASHGLSAGAAQNLATLITTVYEPGLELDGRHKSFSKAADHLVKVFENSGSDIDTKTANLLFTIYLCHLVTEKPPRYLFKGMANKTSTPGEAKLKAGAAQFLPMHEDEVMVTKGMTKDEQKRYAEKRDNLADGFRLLNFTACRNISLMCRDIECRIDLKSKSLNSKYGFRPKNFNENSPGPFILSAEADRDNRAMVEWASIKRIQLLEHINAGEARDDAERVISSLFATIC